MQPTMGPVQIDGKPVPGKSTGDLLLSIGRQVLGEEAAKGPLKWASFEELVKDEWKKLATDYGAGQPFIDFWQAALERGAPGAPRRPRQRRPRPTCHASRRRPPRSKAEDRTPSSCTRPRVSTTAGGRTSRGCRKRRMS